MLTNDRLRSSSSVRPLFSTASCFADRAAVQRAQEVVQQSLSGRGVVEDVADERGLRGLGDEVAEPLGRRVEPFEEERVDGGVRATAAAPGGDPSPGRSR